MFTSYFVNDFVPHLHHITRANYGHRSCAHTESGCQCLSRGTELLTFPDVMTEILRQLRLYLEGSSQALSAQEVYAFVDNFVTDVNASEEPESSICNLENELQVIRDTLDLSDCARTEALLSVLRHLEPVLSSTSLISTWFDLVLRPALREPNLSHKAITQAKELVIVALEKPDSGHPEIQGEFRRRILDLYLLDASNEASAEDVLEWAELPREQRDQRRIWKENLEDIIVGFGMDQPEVRS